eukprot:CAMPEP_0114972184 /NCGR_PEP_ID=MMETSP0216-20121206/255_1 /TAXON_ID=223996 /ORGANISM="Protocruzia adherens, Strain Boccale" /LENGTH=507 /DNA_ID=CAMNT_0002332531 /DNA_START=630 /DNA_END=2153 /DNA_ORIENTATION=-
MFEARYKTQDLNNLINKLNVGVAVMAEDKVLLSNKCYMNFTQKIKDPEQLCSSTSSYQLICAPESEDLDTDTSLVQNGEHWYDVSQQWIEYLDQRAQVVVIQDVTTQQKAIAEMERLEHFRSNLIRTVSHDYRTPLNVIINGLDLISHCSELPPNLSNMSQLCHQAAQFLVYLVDDLLDYYQIKTNVFRLSTKEFDIRDLVNTTLKLLSLKANTAGIKLEAVFDINVPSVFESDPDRFRQVLINLVTNAIKYSPPNSQICVKLSRTDEELLCEVVDHGMGKGVGLGLWICQQICSELGSGVQVESEYGVGTTFSFGMRTIVQDIREKSNGKKRKSVPEIRSADSRRQSCTTDDIRLELDTNHSSKVLQKCQEPKVLIIDDEPFNQIVLRELLTPLGAICHLASNGEEALQLLKTNNVIEAANSDDRQPFDMIITDYDMPRMSGPELIAKIRQMEYTIEGFRAGHIVGHTAYGAGEEAELRRSGADFILPKPVSPQLLRQIMDDCFEF